MPPRAIESRVQLGQVLIEWMLEALGAVAASRVVAGLNSGGQVILKKRVWVAGLTWNITTDLCIFPAFKSETLRREALIGILPHQVMSLRLSWVAARHDVAADSPKL